VPISNELFLFDLWAHTDSRRMVGLSSVFQINRSIAPHDALRESTKT
jgi:hypothetical protein